MYAICEGENNTLYVIDGQSHIVELDCSTTDFKRKQSLYDLRQNLYYSCLQPQLLLCYIPFQNRLIVWTDQDREEYYTLFVISCESGQLLWSVEARDYVRLQYLPEHKGVLVCESCRARKLQIICPETGMCTQEIPFPCSGCTQEIPFLCYMAVQDMLVSKGSLFVLGNHLLPSDMYYSRNKKISCIVFRVE